MTRVDSLAELLTHLNTQRQVGAKLVPQLSDLDINFDLSIPLNKSSVKRKFPTFNGLDFVFAKCTFSKKLIFDNSPTNFYFLSCAFNEIKADDKELNGKIRFRKCDFKSKVLLDNTSFRDLADFWHSTFHKKTVFHKVDFDETVVFSGSRFKENVLFTYTLFAKLGIFRGTICDQGFDISLSILEGSLSMFDFELKNYEAIDGSLAELEYESLVHEKGDIPIKNKRETFRILKNIFEKNSDHITSLYYKRLELSTYDDLLKDRIKLKINPWTSRLNRFILWLNFNSNKHGTSYLRGIFFTLIIGFVFFYFSLVATEKYEISLIPNDWTWEAVKESLKYYFISLSPVHKYTYMDDLVPSWAFYIADFIGRTFVSYGIYQTVQAFRKFR